MRYIDLKLLAFLTLLTALSTLSAVALLPDSSFNPKVQSHVPLNLLEEEPEPFDAIPEADSTRLTPPFHNWNSFKDLLVEVFRLQPARKSFLRYSYITPKLRYHGDFGLRAGLDYNSNQDDNFLFMYKGWDYAGKLNERLFLDSAWWSGEFFGEQALAAEDELVDSWHSIHDGRISLDNVTGAISYRDEALNLSVGRSRFTIGNNISGSIILSDEVNDYGYFLAEGKLGSFRFSLLNARLMADSTYSVYADPSLNSKNYPDKYLALHQVSWQIVPPLEFYAGESIVYGNRNWDINYLLPLHFWRAIEHNLSDRDNVLIYAGANLQINPDWLLYGQLALDEFSYGKILTNWWGNKYAIKLGGSGKLLELPGGDSRLGLELTLVRPWTYTHYWNHNMYSTGRRPLGYAKGSNLMDVTAELCLPILPHLELNTALSYTKQGSFGSSWNQNYMDEFAGNTEDATAEWFQGDIEEEWSLASSLKVDLLAHHSLLAGIQVADDTRFNLSWQIRY
ncbi:MAG TPA: hypothetical protein PLX59_04510 [Candidatus Cloacimonadota bacterium]|nr:hypothetical protein [Candidatus Cloacimonadota bacterium]